MRLHTEVLREVGNSKTPPIVFIHGFTGSSHDWNEIAKDISPDFSIYAIDLPGHGKSASPDDVSLYTAEALNVSIKESIEQLSLRKVIIIGYSMGGRAAINFAVNNSQLVHALVLESASPGIRDFDDRNVRIQNDEKIASLLLSSSIEKFIDYWMNIPLFESQKSLAKEKLYAVRQNKLKSNKYGLANSLRGFGTGSMPVLWDALQKIICPTLLITGEYDEKFTVTNKTMRLLMRNATHHIVPDCGHNIHLERPEHFLNLTNNFLLKYCKTDED